MSAHPPRERRDRKEGPEEERIVAILLPRAARDSAKGVFPKERLFPFLPVVFDSILLCPRDSNGFPIERNPGKFRSTCVGEKRKSPDPGVFSDIEGVGFGILPRKDVPVFSPATSRFLRLPGEVLKGYCPGCFFPVPKFRKVLRSLPAPTQGRGREKEPLRLHLCGGNSLRGFAPEWVYFREGSENPRPFHVLKQILRNGMQSPFRKGVQ